MSPLILVNSSEMVLQTPWASTVKYLKSPSKYYKTLQNCSLPSAFSASRTSPLVNPLQLSSRKRKPTLTPRSITKCGNQIMDSSLFFFCGAGITSLPSPSTTKWALQMPNSVPAPFLSLPGLTLTNRFLLLFLKNRTGYSQLISC